MEKETKYYNQYANYLENISIKGKIYRKFFYFPKLYRCLKGKKLEVGCGTGGFLEVYNDVIGIDINPECIKICKQKNLNVTHMEIDKINFNDNEFDSILIDNVLEHLEKPENLISEMKRVLTPSGIVVVSVPGAKGFLWDKDHKKNYNKIELEKIFCQQGFTTQKIFYTPFKSKILDTQMRQYCLHGIFKKKLYD